MFVRKWDGRLGIMRDNPKRRRPLVVCLMVVVLIALCSNCSWGKVIYVDDDAPPGRDGSSWQKACKYLQDALAVAGTVDKPVEIRVAQGIYKPDRTSAKTDGTRDRFASFCLIDQVSIRGGFAGVGAADPNARDVAAYKSILSGDLAGNDVELTDPLAARDEPTRTDNSYHVVSYNANWDQHGDLSAELDGFVVTAGCAFFYKEHGSVNITTSDWNCGGGLFIRGVRTATTRLTVRGCQFTGNYSEATGGAIHAYLVNDLAIVESGLTSNGSHIHGGGVWTGSWTASVKGCGWAGLDRLGPRARRADRQSQCDIHHRGRA